MQVGFSVSIGLDRNYNKWVVGIMPRYATSNVYKPVERSQSMKPLEKRCMRTLIGPGRFAYDAEMVIEEEGRVSFLHANYNNGEHFTVGDGSIFDYMTQQS
jgi:hypothetical protein